MDFGGPCKQYKSGTDAYRTFNGKSVKVEVGKGTEILFSIALKVSMYIGWC